jgi:hypothetical protein
VDQVDRSLEFLMLVRADQAEVFGDPPFLVHVDQGGRLQEFMGLVRADQPADF